MNVYDSARMRDALQAHYAAETVTSADEADIIVLNTCSIREKAQEKVFSDLGRWRQLKAKKQDLVIAVGGCVASQEGDALLRRAPYVDVVFGPQTLHRLPELIDRAREKGTAVIDISFPEIEKFDQLPKPQADSVSGYISIMEGCSKYCSFCIVPYTRGEEISRPFDDVIAETVGLAEQGVREVTFLGQNVNDYYGVMHDGHYADLALLIEYAAAIEGIDRIRFSTSHPNAFSDRLIAAYASTPALANHLHLPVQSGSDRILTRMKRGYTALEFKSRCRKLRSVRPDITISSDFIVGFPGETETDFMATLDLVAEVGFDQSYSFIYSARPGTPAANYPDDVSLDEKKQRLQRLQMRLNQQAQRISEAMLGTVVRVLVTEPSKRRTDELMGRAENNRIVNFSSDEACIGQFVDLMITEVRPNSLRGELVTADVM